jgi:hypothetical protein
MKRIVSSWVPWYQSWCEKSNAPFLNTKKNILLVKCAKLPIYERMRIDEHCSDEKKNTTRVVVVNWATRTITREVDVVDAVVDRDDLFEISRN